MTTTHTPGPWRVEQSTRTDQHIIAGNRWIATASNHDFHPTAEENERTRANARLIAAAPDLLAALRGVVLCADARGDAEPLDAYQTRAAMLPGQIARAYAAIVRATRADA